MNLLENLEKNSLVKNTKGGLYYATSFNDNLDLFCKINRFTEDLEVGRYFTNAFNENVDLALANLLYTLDIRNGKGERRLFKTMYKRLCLNNKEQALRVLPFVADLGRFDYVLEGVNTLIDEETVVFIKAQLEDDLKSDRPSLLGKWMPSIRTHKCNNTFAMSLAKKLNMSEKEYRKMLSALRNKINIIEKTLTEKNYSVIDLETVPTKAMLKYREAFRTHLPEAYDCYMKAVKEGKARINTDGLFCYEIIKKIWNNNYLEKEEIELFDLMWNNQKNVIEGNSKNILVMADTSESMTRYNCLPLANSIGLALYTAERNNGYFSNKFIAFSSRPQLVTVKGKNIVEKVHNMRPIVERTDIDKTFEMLLNSAIEANISQKEMPEEIIIISDMEFDSGVCSKNGTNFNGWKETFKKFGYTLPKIVFWNVAGSSFGVPACKYDNGCMMISGFSTNLLTSLLNVTEFKPVEAMMEILAPYLTMLGASI